MDPDQGMTETQRLDDLERELAWLQQSSEQARTQRYNALECCERNRKRAEERHDQLQKQLVEVRKAIDGWEESRRQAEREEEARKLKRKSARPAARRGGSEASASAMSLMELVSTLVHEREEERIRAAEARQMAAAQTESMAVLIEEMRRESAEQRALIMHLSNGWYADSARHHKETLQRIKKRAQREEVQSMYSSSPWLVEPDGGDKSKKWI